MSHDVFISHSSKDKPVANAVCETLERAGIGCWIAPRDILPGKDWSEAIVEGIAACSVTVLVFSEAAQASTQVRREVERAFEKGHAVVPLRIDQVSPSGAFEYYLSSVHWLDATAPPLEPHLEQLRETVRRLLPMRRLGADERAGRGANRTGDRAEDRSPGPSTDGTAGSNTDRRDGPAGTDVTDGVSAAAASAAPPAGNLPPPPSAYIGREAEREQWLDLLRRPTTRVLTLVGFGGMGKTRTALDLATRCAADFPDGAWWVELEAARTAEEMAQCIAGALRLTLERQPSIEDQVAAHLRDRHLLLVLDNTEQISDAGAVVHRLLRRAPQVRWLVTSRRPLDLAEEQTVEIPPLPPAAAEELFVERARARQSGFARAEENAADIAEICRRLEGLPLAIELASARVVMMTPRDILAHLNECFRLLQTRSPHLPPRQRAIQGAIEWSHNLLEEDEKALFAQLAVFSNGFTLPTAEAVCDVWSVMEGVYELRRHSLLRAETHAPTQQMRFFMLELVREFAEQKLDDGDVRLRHADYFLQYAEERVPRIRTTEGARALEELSVELDNLRAALRWAGDSGESERCARLALALYPPLYYRGFWTEARRCLTAGYAASAALTGEARRLRATLERLLASMAQDTGDLAGARSRAEASVALYLQLGDRQGVADAFNLLGLIALDEKDAGTARRSFEDSLRLRPDDDPAGRAMALHNLAFLAHQVDGDDDDAKRLYEESLVSRRAAGDARGEAETLGNLGVLAHVAGDYAGARRLYGESLALRRALKEVLGVALMLHNLGEIEEADGDPERAVFLFTHAERSLRELGSAFAAEPAEGLRRAAERMGAEAFAAARHAAQETTWEQIID